MPLPPVTIYDPRLHTHIIPQIITVHRDCVRQDNTLATIIDVDHPTKLLSFWTTKHEEAVSGRRVIFLQFASEDEDDGEDEDKEEELAGVAMLDMPPTETGPFRAVVEKLLTSPRHRKKGVAKALMEKLEEVAREERRYLLTLDTVIGSGADLVYPKLGYTKVGVIPNYGISPKDGRLMNEVFFYKDLRDEET